MLRLTGYELGKILKRKIVFAAFALLAVLGGMLYLGDGPQSVISRLPDGTYIGGAEAIAYDKGIAEKYEGVLTEEKVQDILKTYAPGAPDGGFWTINSIYNAIQDSFGNIDGSYNGLTVEEAFPDYRGEEPLRLGQDSGGLPLCPSGGGSLRAGDAPFVSGGLWLYGRGEQYSDQSLGSFKGSAVLYELPGGCGKLHPSVAGGNTASDRGNAAPFGSAAHALFDPDGGPGLIRAARFGLSGPYSKRGSGTDALLVLSVGMDADIPEAPWREAFLYLASGSFGGGSDSVCLLGGTEDFRPASGVLSWPEWTIKYNLLPENSYIDFLSNFSYTM